MKKIIFLVLAVISISKNIQAQEIQNRVLLIGIDGCRPDALLAANAPNIDALAANGTYSWDALNSDITISGPGWSAMLTGVWSNKHLVVDNNFTQKNYTDYPHFMKRVENHFPGCRTASISQWAPINTHIASTVPCDLIQNPVNTADVVAKAKAEIQTNDAKTIFLHFDDVDHAGHSYGFSPTVPQYIDAIQTVDAGIGEVIAALKARPGYGVTEKWVVMVSTDHGGIGFNHGGTTMEERNIFVIVSGDDIPKTEIKKTAVNGSVPFDCLGNTHYLNFDGANDMVTVPSNTAHNFGTTQDFTIECRVKTTTAADVQIVGKKNWDSGLNKGYVFSFTPSTQKWKVNVGDGTRRVDIDGAVINDNNWHTLSATFDRDGMVKLYTDGILNGSKTMANITDINTTLPFTIGSDGNSNYDFKGAVAEVRVFNTVVSPENINTWKCTEINTTHANYANLVSYYRLNQGSGLNATDSGTANTTGTISGATWINASDVPVTYDYSGTPRTVDIVPTAFDYLCIPIQTSWGLDGHSLITSCAVLNRPDYGSKEEFDFVKVYPNPVKSGIPISFETQDMNQKVDIYLYDAMGKLVFTQKNTPERSFNFKNRTAGLYSLVIKGIDDNKSITKKIIVEN
ncbi:alkaline phosphatase family protein [Flavobacterium sp. '19STA2R22 D10 B1']|uniref:alkaline phosphatase family protein n=1 Tax=Flavobacterium aerium TaxID=3037261 RepID=UPI00278C7D76|nr:alkaline phosphatase family protein [Flavobacterium sp. '19STA2R22 D10 B1']